MRKVIEPPLTILCTIKSKLIDSLNWWASFQTTSKWIGFGSVSNEFDVNHRFFLNVKNIWMKFNHSQYWQIFLMRFDITAFSEQQMLNKYLNWKPMQIKCTMWNSSTHQKNYVILLSFMETFRFKTEALYTSYISE